jgi:hypothetical protein
MHQSTLATLDQLKRADWFAKVGINDALSAIVLSSWDEALACCAKLEWRNLRLRAANQLRARIVEKSRDRFQDWNHIVVEIKKTSIPFVKERIDKIARENHLPKAFEDAVQWDILHLCMEAEYADIVPASFYAGTAYWYAKGHFPCGWRVEPAGDARPIIY